jgi:hypothetical protein
MPMHAQLELRNQTATLFIADTPVDNAPIRSWDYEGDHPYGLIDQYDELTDQATDILIEARRVLIGMGFEPIDEPSSKSKDLVVIAL